MAVTWVAAGTKAEKPTTSGTTVSVSVPAGHATGDVLVLVAHPRGAGNTLATPAGWTLFGDSGQWATIHRTYLFWKVAASASEPAVTLTMTTAEFCDAQMYAFRGADTVAPIDAAVVFGTAGTAQNVPIPAITTVTNNALMVFLGDGATSRAWLTPPAGATERVESSFWVAQFVVATETKAVAGTEAADVYARDNTGNVIAASFAIRPPVAPTTTTARFTRIKVGAGLAGSSLGSGVIQFALADATAAAKGGIQLAGDLTGTAASPQIAAGAVTDAEVAAANKDGLAALPSLRTLGTGAQQAAAGNDSRLNYWTLAGSDLSTTYRALAGGNLVAKNGAAQQVSIGDVIGSVPSIAFGTDGTGLWRRSANVIASIGGFAADGALGAWGFQAFATGDAQPRAYLRNDGYLLFGLGALAGDTNLYRSAAGVLKSDGALLTAGGIASYVGAAGQVNLSTVGGAAGIVFGNAADTNLYRSAAGVLRTDGTLELNPGGIGNRRVEVGAVDSGGTGYRMLRVLN